MTGIIGSTSLLVPSPLMVPAARYIVTVEVMAENAALGLAAVWLLRPPRKRV